MGKVLIATFRDDEDIEEGYGKKLSPIRQGQSTYSRFGVSGINLIMR